VRPRKARTADGWSTAIMIRELTTLYDAFVRGHAPSLPALPLQYADYALWQREWLHGPALETHLAYWRRQLAALPALELPSDHPRPPIISYRGATLAVRLPPTLSDGLHALGQQEDSTVFMLLLCGLGAVAAFGRGAHRRASMSASSDTPAPRKGATAEAGTPMFEPSRRSSRDS